jgi:ribosomal protein L11 methyltransferase
MTSSPTYEYRFTCPVSLCEYASDLLWAMPGVDSVMIRYQDDDDGVEQPYAISIFSQQAGLQEQLAGILAYDEVLAPALTGVSWEQSVMAEADWAEAWKAHWDVDAVIPGILTICPSWKTHTPVPGETMLHLDPGSAFGTGAHETTRLMLQRLYALHQVQPVTGLRVMDLGCGSGILALYAAKLGASHVSGLDIDALAVDASLTNATRNSVSDQCAFTTLPLDKLGVPSRMEDKLDLMLVNILGPVIISLLPAIVEHLKPGAPIICSGLIERSCDELQAAMEAMGFRAFHRVSMGKWLALEALAPEG